MDSLFEIALRVPPLIVLDHILATNFGTKTQSHYEFLKTQIDNFLFNKSLAASTKNLIDDDEFNEQNTTYLTINLNLFVFILSFTLFLLSSKHVKRFYLCLISISLILISNYFNTMFISFLKNHTTEVEDKIPIFDYELIKASLISYVAQLILVEILCLIKPSRTNNNSNDLFYFNKKQFSHVLFALPTIIGVLFQPSFNLLHNISVTLTIVSCFNLLIDWVSFIKDVCRVVTDDYVWCKHVIKYNGLLHLLQLQWQRLMIPRVLKTFWLTKFFYQLTIIGTILFMNLNYFKNQAANDNLINGKDLLLFILKQLLIAGCETLICVSGMSSILCSILNKIGQLILKFLIVIDDGEDRSLGKISAILFFVLALQTGLTEISAELRFIRLYRNLCLLLTANLYVIHGMVNPLLLTLSASKNRSLNRHARPLFVCLLLIFFPTWFLIFLWKHNPLSTWLLAVTTFCIEIIIKVNLTLLIYALYMIDAYRSTIWERLDDYVFFIKSFQSAIQFVFSVFIFCNGAFILIYESGGAIRAMMISIHAYFNIWTQFKEGWKVFSKRRKAVSKLDMLRDATAEELSKFNDVCAICYQELLTAKVTLCNHYFHSTCLRKWLNMNDSCPLCLSIMFKTTKEKDDLNNINQSTSSSSNSDTSNSTQLVDPSISLSSSNNNSQQQNLIEATNNNSNQE